MNPAINVSSRNYFEKKGREEDSRGGSILVSRNVLAVTSNIEESKLFMP